MRGVLCLHGFSGGPFELQPLIDALVAQGTQVSAPTLAGHGAGTAELAAATWHDWLASARTAMDALVAATGEPVLIVGGSMGGLLALRLARQRPDAVAGLVLLAPPLRLRPIEQRGIAALASLAELLGMGRRAMVPKTAEPDVMDPAVRAGLSYGNEYPLPALSTFLELQDAVRDDVGFVATPVLIVHGKRDRTVPIAVSDELARRLASLRVQRLDLDDSGHLLALDVDRARLIDAVTTFMHSLSPVTVTR
jgi:carboxylesterase